MGLRIVSEQLQSGEEPNIPPDEYPDRLRKYIPTEAVSFWLFVSGVIQSTGDDVPKVAILWLLFVIGVVGTFAWTRYQTKEPKKKTAWTQILISCIAFIVWVIATGGPLLQAIPFYQPVYGTLLLAIYTFFVPLIIPPEQ